MCVGTLCNGDTFCDFTVSENVPRGYILEWATFCNDFICDLGGRFVTGGDVLYRGTLCNDLFSIWGTILMGGNFVVGDVFITGGVL